MKLAVEMKRRVNKASIVLSAVVFAALLASSHVQAQEQSVSSESSTLTQSSQTTDGATLEWNVSQTVRQSSSNTAPESEDARTPLRLDGKSVEVEDSSEDADAAPNRLLIEVPEGCRVVANEGSSLIIEDADGTRAEVVVGGEGGDGIQASMIDGKLSLSNEDGGNLETVGGDGALTDEPKVVGAEGFFCREFRAEDEDEPDERVLAETTSEEREEEQAQSEAQQEEDRSGERNETQRIAGQHTEPLEETAVIDRDADDASVIESIEIGFSCEVNEEPRITDGASITLEDEDGEQFEFTAGDDVDITDDGDNIVIEPSSDDFEELDGDTANVVEVSGITCGAATSAGNPGPDTADADTADANTASSQTLSCPSGQTATDIEAFSNSVTRRGTRETDQFTTSGSSFQVSYQVTAAAVDPDDASSFSVELLDDSDQAAGADFEADLSDSSTSDSDTLVVELPAGTYSFRVVAENVQYDIVVAECDTDTSDTDSSDTDTSDTDTSDTDTSDTDTSDTDTSDTDPSRNVITSTVPNRTLANTGGPRLFVVATGLVFVCFGASLIRLLSRRGRGM